MKTEYDIVITGLAAISAAGVGTGALSQVVAEGRSVLSPVPPEVTGQTGHLWGKAEAFRAADYMPPLKARRFDRGSLFAVVASGMALKDGGVETCAGEANRIGIALGCGFGGIANSQEFLRGWFARGSEGLVPMLFPNTVPNAPASNASIEHGLRGPNVTQVQRFCSAEAAFQMACRFMDEGRTDMMLAGGVDELNETIVQGFASAGQLRGWGKGFGEGCGMLLLERRQAARERGARIHATLREIRTIGRIVPGAEAEALDRLCGTGRPDRVSFSGSAAETPLLRERFRHVPQTCVGPLIGRSLAMGGLALVALIASLSAGEQATHLAASPEGPYFAIDITGGDPVQS